jgi:hypothetical protein
MKGCAFVYDDENPPKRCGLSKRHHPRNMLDSHPDYIPEAPKVNAVSRFIDEAHVEAANYADGTIYPNKHNVNPANEYSLQQLRLCAKDDFMAGVLWAFNKLRKGDVLGKAGDTL